MLRTLVPPRLGLCRPFAQGRGVRRARQLDRAATESTRCAFCVRSSATGTPYFVQLAEGTTAGPRRQDDIPDESDL